MKNIPAILCILFSILTVISACSDDDDASGPGLGLSVEGKTVRLNGGISELCSTAFATYKANSNGTVAGIMLLGYTETIPKALMTEPPKANLNLNAKCTSDAAGTLTGSVMYYWIDGTNAYRYISDSTQITLSGVGAAGDRIKGTFSANNVSLYRSPTNDWSWTEIRGGLTITGGTIDVLRATNNAIVF